MDPKPTRAIVIGSGQRGTAYAQFAVDFPNKLKIVGVAEPREFYRKRAQQWHGIDDSHAFSSWEQAAALDKLADIAIIGTPDRLHKAPAVALAAKGYHILLEKPMACSAADCLEIVETCRRHNVILAVCHVLRYMPQSLCVEQLINNGEIGDVVNIQLREPIGFWHFAHSYVRGNWRNETLSSFSLLAKSCHDLDLIMSWMGQRNCINISSFGNLRHFTIDNKPAGASSRCLDCAVEPTCAYSAKKIYLDRVKQGYTHWPVDVVTDVPDIESVTEALRSGPYGRCVYECDNDVCDNQVVNLEFDDGSTVSFTMVAFTADVCVRHAKIFGTKGEITVDLSKDTVDHYDFLTGTSTPRTYHHPSAEEAASSCLQGHGGADFYAINAFIKAVQSGDPSLVLTGPDEALRSHLVVFAAETARKKNSVINFPTWLKEVGATNLT